ncbi:MAG: alpha/beta fold hydrolase [Pirellulales bacterium]|nr:alpha/beta fold hydrolase [Pirellulales bacterium]
MVHSIRARLLFVICCFVALMPAIAAGQAPRREYKPPDDINYRQATILSEGVRMAAEVYCAKASGDAKLPTIIMSHGWGGQASLLRPEAIAFARAGYLVVAFDYRGWGASDSRVILTSPPPDERPDGRFTAEVLEIREVVDPLDQTNDLLNALHWVQGEPQCDTAHIGLWGSSYSGGHVVYAAARDPRVKATVSQVPALDSRFVVLAEAEREKTYSEATQRARGEIGYPPPGARVVGNLKGAPIREKMINYAPVEDAGKAPGCAMLFVLAENEELFDNREHGMAAYEKATGPKKLVILPKIKHYGVYLEARDAALKESLAWFDEHLKTK